LLHCALIELPPQIVVAHLTVPGRIENVI